MVAPGSRSNPGPSTASQAGRDLSLTGSSWRGVLVTVAPACMPSGDAEPAVAQPRRFWEAHRADVPRAYERRLISAAQRGDREARDALIEQFRPMIASVARLYKGCPAVDHAELMQEGMVGLLRALERFDPALRTPFWAYASWWVRQAMRERAVATPRGAERRREENGPTSEKRNAQVPHASRGQLMAEPGTGGNTGGIGLGGILVIVGIVVMIVWSFWLGLIILLVGLIAFGGFARGRWY